MSEVLVTINQETTISLSNRAEVESFVNKAIGNREVSDWYIAAALNECYLNQYYKVADSDGKSFTKFEAWASETFGFAKSTANNYRNAFANCYYFKDGKIMLRHDAFIGFTVSKVNEMNTLFTQKGFEFVVNAIENGDLKAGMTIKELRKSVKDLLTEVVVEQNGEPQNGEPQNGEPQNGEPQNGEPQNGEPQNGEPKNGEPQNGEQSETKESIVQSIKDALNKTRMNAECRNYVLEQLEKLLK